jgi:hypothetical protein
MSAPSTVCQPRVSAPPADCQPPVPATRLTFEESDRPGDGAIQHDARRYEMTTVAVPARRGAPEIRPQAATRYD